MGNRTSKQNLVSHDMVIAKQDSLRSSSVAQIWWGNMQSVVKLRQKGTTKVSKLPSGVFRHMLEYEFPIFRFRYSEPTGPIEQYHDRHFPAIGKLSYRN